MLFLFSRGLTRYTVSLLRPPSLLAQSTIKHTHSSIKLNTLLSEELIPSTEEIGSSSLCMLLAGRRDPVMLAIADLKLLSVDRRMSDSKTGVKSGAEEARD